LAIFDARFVFLVSADPDRAGVPVGLLAADDKCGRFVLKTTNKTTIKLTINYLNT
jgi:hypothetical protein